MSMFKIAVYVPEEYCDGIMDAVTESVDPVYPNYDRVFSATRVTGTWRPLEGSDPFKGTVGEIERAEELKLEFIVRARDLKKAVSAVLRVHPYEEPAIDVIELVDWRSL